MSENRPAVLYVDQTAKLAGGELNLYDFLRSSPDSSSVALFEDGPFVHLLEEVGIPVFVVPLGSVGEIRRGAGIKSVARVLLEVLDLRKRLLLLTKRAEIVYANSQKAFLLSAVSRRRRQPLIWHLHDMLVPEHFSTFLRKLAVFAGNHFATRIIVNSQATADAFVAEGGVADKIRVVYCGVDPAPFDAVTQDEATVLRASVCPGQHFLVGVFGRLAEWKGQHVLLEAVSSMPDIHIAVIGDALFGEEAYKERLVERASRPDLSGRVHFLGFRKDIPELMKCVDVIAHTSTSPEPFGRVIVEGMLAGKPVMATNAGGAMEIIEHGRSGLLTSPGSVGELRDALKSLRDNSERAQELAVEGRRRAEAFFSLSGMVDGIQRVIDELRNAP